MADWTQHIENLPDLVLQYPNWIPVSNNKVPTKEGWGNPETWLSYDEIPGKKGIVIDDTPLLVLDFDHVLNKDGTPDKRCTESLPKIVKRIYDLLHGERTYCERSLSGTGLHMIFVLNEQEYHNISFAGGEPGTIPLHDGGREAYDREDAAKLNPPKCEIWYNCVHQFVLTGDITKKTRPKQPPVGGDAAGAVMDFLIDQLEKTSRKEWSGKVREESGTAEEEIPVLSDDERKRLLSALNEIDPDIDYHTWIRVGKACKNSGLPYEEWDAWSRKGDKYESEGKYSTSVKWKTFKYSSTSWNAGTIVNIAKKYGWTSGSQDRDRGIEALTPEEEAKIDAGYQQMKAKKAAQDSSASDPEAGNPIKPEPLQIPTVKAPIGALTLLRKELPEINWIVRDLLTEGLGLLVAPPKSWKSFMCLQLGLCVAAGFPFLGFPTVKGKVLYLDLESTERRPRDRLRVMVKHMKQSEDFDNLQIQTVDAGYKRLDAGFIDQLSQVLKDYPGFSLVIVDVFQRIKGRPARNLNAYEADYAALTALGDFAREHHICVLIVHHTRKAVDASDWANEISGSTGIAGNMDAIFALRKKKREDHEAELHVTGREIRGQTLIVRWDESSFLWSCRGTADDVAAEQFESDYASSPIVQALKKAVDVYGTWCGSVTDLIDAAGYWRLSLSEYKPQQIGTEINRFTRRLSIDGYEVLPQTRKGNKRVYTISKKDNTPFR